MLHEHDLRDKTRCGVDRSRGTWIREDKVIQRRTKLEGQLWCCMTRRWSLSLGLVDGRNEGLWMLYGKMSGQGGSENEQSKWWTVEHGMPRGARKWEMFGHRDFVNRDCVLRLTPQERVKWCRKRACGRKKRWDERRLWSKRSRYEPRRRNPWSC